MIGRPIRRVGMHIDRSLVCTCNGLRHRGHVIAGALGVMGDNFEGI